MPNLIFQNLCDQDRGILLKVHLVTNM